MAKHRGRRTCGRQNENRAHRVPAAHQVQSRATKVPFATEVLRKLAQAEAERNEQRHDLERCQEQHWYEQKLRRYRVGERDLELDAGGQCVTRDERDRDAQATMPVIGRQPEEKRDRRRNERRRDGQRRQELAIAEPAAYASA